MKMLDQREQVLEYLASLGYIVAKDEFDNQIKIKYPENEDDYNLIIELVDGFFFDFPKIYVTKEFSEKVKILAHLFQGNSLCLKFDGKESINPERQVEVIAYALSKATIIIDKALSNSLESEKYDELDKYWGLKNETKTDLSIFSFIRSERYSENLVRFGYYIKTKNNKIYIIESKNDFYGFNYINTHYDIDFDKSKQLMILNIHSKELAYLLKDFKELIKYLYLCKNEEIKKYLDSHRQEGVIVLQVKELSNKQYAVLYTFKGFTNQTVKKDIQRKIKLNSNDYSYQYLVTKELSKDKLFYRSSDNKKNQKYQNICIVGCGSLGSYSAEMISSLGASKLTLIDFDIFTEKNLLRHTNGLESIDIHKVISLKFNLLSKFPYLNIDDYIKSVFEIDIDSFNQNQFDLLIVATGKIESEYYCLQNFLKKQIAKQVAIMWVEPYAFSGHVIMYNYDSWVNKNIDSLYSDINMISGVRNKSEYYLKDIGCNSAYIPYSSLYVQNFLSSFFTKSSKIKKSAYTFSMVLNKTSRKEFSMQINDKFSLFNDGDFEIGELYD